MAIPKTPEEVKAEVFEWLKTSRYASTSLEPLSGGSSNFLYRAHLSNPLEDGTTDVVIKQGKGHMAVSSADKLSTERPQIEVECLKALGSFQVNASQYIVRTPKCYLYNEATNSQILEYLDSGINLKAFALNNFPSPTPESLRPLCQQLGKALAQYITTFHRKAEQEMSNWLQNRNDGHEPGLYASLKNNKVMQDLKHYINYDWLLQRIDQFPDILEEAREVFTEVKEEALNELKGDLIPIHGDFWTGNILLPNAPIQHGVETPIFVVDWEYAQLGVPAMDHGEMLGELYALWLYRKIDAGLWMVQGYVDGLGEQTETSAWRTALQVGCHLLSFGTAAPGWGTPDQVKEVARVGRDILVNSWKRNREWFEKSEVACLMARAK